MVLLYLKKLEILFLMFYLFLSERERERMHSRVGEGQRERDRGSKADSALTTESPMQGWISLTNHHEAMS